MNKRPLRIRIYPDPCLRRVADPVPQVDKKTERLVDDMIHTMYEAGGIGLAAVQVNVPKRVTVVDVSEDRNNPQVFINPEIVHTDGAAECEEGCLSLPGICAPVTRAARVRVRALDRAGRPLEIEAEGILAVCLQHEIDHLNGKLFIDYLSRLKRDRLIAKMNKQLQDGATAGTSGTSDAPHSKTARRTHP